MVKIKYPHKSIFILFPTDNKKIFEPTLNERQFYNFTFYDFTYNFKYTVIENILCTS